MDGEKENRSGPPGQSPINTQLSDTADQSDHNPESNKISYNQLVDIIEFLPDATFVIDREGRVIAWNRAIEEMTGVLQADILGKGDYAYALPFYHEARPIVIDYAMGTGGGIEPNYDFVEREGDTCYAETFSPFLYQGKGAYLWGKASPLYDSRGNIIGAVESIRDITVRKNAEIALRKSEEKYRELVESANSIILRMDTEGNITFFNEFAQKFFGYTEEEVLGRNTVGTIVPATDSEGRNLSRMMSELVRNPDKYGNNQNENMRRDGKRVWVAWTNKALRDEHGEVKEVLCVGNDISLLKQIEGALRKSESQLRMLLDTMNEGVGVQDENGVITYANDKLCRILGYSRDQLIGRKKCELYDPLCREVFEREIARRKEGKSSTYEAEMVTATGAVIPVIVSGSPIFDENGVFRGSIGTQTDISMLRETEYKLSESEEKYRMIFEHTPLGIFHFDDDGIVSACNDKIIEIWGTSKEKFLGFNLLSSVKNKKMKAAVKACLSGRYACYEGNYLSVTGGKITNLKADYGPVLSSDGVVTGGIGIIEDISERKMAEEALQESESRLRLLSSQLIAAQENERKRIAGELHDSIGSLLSSIKFSVENALGLAKKSELNPELLRPIVALVQHAIDESRRITADLRPAMLDDLGVVTTLRWFVRHFQSVYPDISLKTQINLEEADVPEHLKIVIFRVVQEAFHNIAKHSGAKEVVFRLENPDERIRLEIEDNGRGFDPITLSGKGKAGLGLVSMKERTEFSDGQMTIDSREGSGTMIRAFWPIGC